MRRLNEIEKRLARCLCDNKKQYVYEVLNGELKDRWQGYQVSRLTNGEMRVLSEKRELWIRVNIKG